jgi:glycosyltransferase involved in cell wall biosynthesis
VRIAYLSCDFGVPVVGTRGSTVHVRQVVRALQGLGNQVRVYSPNPGPEGDETFVAIPLAGIAGETDRLLKRDAASTPSHLRRELRRVIYAEHVQHRLMPLLLNQRPDVIYERYSLFGHAGVELAKTLGVPLMLEVNSPLAQEAARHRGLVLQETASQLERRILNEASAVLVVSKALVGHATSLGVPQERIQVVPTGVDAEAFRPDVSSGGWRERLRLLDKRVVGFVGSLRPWHDLETVVSAVRLLVEEGVPAHLLVVGDGPPLDGLAAQSDVVTCTGAVLHQDVPALHAAMDAVVVPYAADDDPYFSPIKMYEAMASGRIVVGARIGQVADVIADGETGLLYRPGDPADLARKLAAALQRDGRSNAIGAAARDAVLDRYTWKHVAQRIVETANRLVTEKSQR